MPDLRTGPPSRFRVVERDRRLVVIDTATGVEPATSTAFTPTSANASAWFPRKVSFDGSVELTTLAFYDAHGPRTIRLDPGAATLTRIAGWAALATLALAVAAFFLFPIAIVPIGIALAQGRSSLRDRVTRWLDTVARDGS